MAAGAAFFDQFYFADIAANAFLEIYFFLADGASWAGPFANNTDCALGDTLDTQWTDQRYKSKRSAERATVATVEARHNKAGGENGDQDSPKNECAIQEK